MAMPYDFNMIGENLYIQRNHIAQNVCMSTAKVFAKEIEKIINGSNSTSYELNNQYIVQDHRKNDKLEFREIDNSKSLHEPEKCYIKIEDEQSIKTKKDKTMKNLYTSFYDAIHFLNNSYVNIPMKVINDNDPDLLNREEEQNEVIATFISNIDEREVNYLVDLFPELEFKYSEYLESYILLISHCGTSWHFVPIEVNTKSKHFEKIKDLNKINFLK